MIDPQFARTLALAGIKSSHSKANGDCFVACRTPDERLAFWQSTQEDNPGRPIVFGTRAEWEAFERGVKDGEFSWDKLPVAVETPHA